MAKFTRSLPPELVTALVNLSGQKKNNWWKEILINHDLHLAIREGYLNVYAKGQSVFKIELGNDGRPIMTTHYKYLLKPKMPPGKEYVTFDGSRFLTGSKAVNSSLFFQESYVENETISELARTAVSYSNSEKAGVHIIARKNADVIDMEVAFSSLREPEDPVGLDETDDGKAGKTKSTAQRIDLAALQADGAGTPRLVFYEAKRFDDARLWGSQPKVLKQIEKYDAFLKANESDIKTAYVNVCKGLVQLRQMKGAKPVSSLVKMVCERGDIVIDKACRLVVFGFDMDQRDHRLKTLKDDLKLGKRMIAQGDPKGLKLPAKA